MKTIRDILPDRFRYTLSPAEEKLIDAVRLGNTAVCRSDDEDADKPENADSWGPERTIRGTLIHWLCTDPDAVALVDDMGVWIDGAKIVGDLSLGSSILPKPLRLYYCDLGHVYLFDTRADTLDFHFSRTRHIFAIGLKTRRDFTLNGVKVDGEVSLRDAEIGGSLLCIGARFIHKRGYSFNAPGLRVRNDMLLSDAKANNEVNLEGAHIGGKLDCHSLRIKPEGWEGLSEEDVKELDAFRADGLKVDGNFILKKARFKNEVRLLGIEIGGDLNCECARFENEGGFAFSADRLVTKGGVFFRDALAKGEVRLLGSDIGGSLYCDRAEFENEGGYALNADGLITKGGVFLVGLGAKGEVRLLSANIGTDLYCISAKLENPSGIAFAADRIATKGNLSLKDVKAKGGVRLASANVGRNLECGRAEFENDGGKAIHLQGAIISGALFLNKLRKISGILDIEHAKVGRFLDDVQSWPDKDKLRLDGFEYGGLPGDTTPRTVKDRLEWIQRQPERPFYPQPYEQLAKVLRQMGHESDAKEILIAKQEDMRKHGNLSRVSRYWNWFLGKTIGHGYQPLKAILYFIIPILLVGSILFGWAEHIHVMQPSKERVYLDAGFKETGKLPSRYPRFEPFIYSADVFIPFVNLHQEDYWLPDATKKHGWWFRVYMWAHIALGWVFSTLAVASLTGLIRKE